jgi:cytochrome P450
LTAILRWLLYQTPLGAVLAGPIVTDMERLSQVSARFLDERADLETNSDKAGNPARKDFFYHLFRGSDAETGRKYTRAELRSESNLLLVAGSDTSATTLCACIFYLLRHTQVRDKLRQELKENFADFKDIKYTGTRLSTLPYLRAVIDETLRLNPPVGGMLSRDVQSPGITVDDVFYEPGLTVGVSAYALHHNADYYPDPFTFKPERWLINERAGVTKEMVDRAQSAFCPFSIGHRGCIGKNLAYLELSLAIARLVWRYDMEEVQGWDQKLGGGHVSASGEYLTGDAFVSVKNGPLVRFRSRKH